MQLAIELLQVSLRTLLSKDTDFFRNRKALETGIVVLQLIELSLDKKEILRASPYRRNQEFPVW